MSKRVGIYVRVSTSDKGQTCENQERELRALALHRSWTVVRVYQDAISGAKGRDRRPGLDAMLKDASRGKLDVVMVWAIDRLGRSLSDLLNFMQELAAANVDLVIHQQALDTTGPMGRLMFHVVGAFAEFERSMIQARVLSGMRRAQAEQAAGKERLHPNGVDRKKRIGRPARVRSAQEMARIRADLDAGETWRAVAKKHRCSHALISELGLGDLG